MSSDGHRLRPDPPFRPVGVGMASCWTCIKCGRRHYSHEGRRRFLSGYACKEKCEVKR